MKERENTAQSDHDLLFLSVHDPEVFGTIVDRYQEAFLRKAVTIIGNEEDAKDVVQEVFVKIYLNAGKFERRAGAVFSSWAYKILLNSCFSHYKKGKRDRGSVSFDETILSESESGAVVEESNIERFLLILSKIPENASRLLRLLVLEGKSYQELAKLEGVSDNNLRVKIHRAKTTFKKILIENPHL